MAAVVVDWPTRERGDSGDCVTSIPSLPFPCLFCYHQHRLDCSYCSYCCDHCFELQLLLLLPSLPSLPLHSHSPSIVHCSASAAAEATPAYQQPFSSLTLQRQPCNKSCRLFFFTLSHQPLSLSFLFPYHFRYLHHFSRCRRPCCTQSSGEGAPKRHQRSTRLRTLSNIDQLSNFFFFLL